MIKHCLAEDRLKWLGHVILVLSHTGMRIGELIGLRWSDVNLDSMTIRVMDERSSRRKKAAGTARTTKGRRSRSIPIHPRLGDLLQTLPRTKDGLVLHAESGGCLKWDEVMDALRRDVIEKLKDRFPSPNGETGFQDGTLHSFRHYFCSQAFYHGASEGEIREWLGHKSSEMVEHYRHLRKEDAQQKMRQIVFVSPEKTDTSPADAA